MANYSYLLLRNKVNPKPFEDTLRRVLREYFGARLEVVAPTFLPEHGCSQVWLVEVVGTSEEVLDLRGRTVVQRRGFLVALAKGRKKVVFRHPVSSFERWLQGVLRESLALHFHAPVYDDADDSTSYVDPQATDRCSYPTYGEYLQRFGARLGNERFVESLWGIAPVGW